MQRGLLLGQFRHQSVHFRESLQIGGDCDTFSWSLSVQRLGSLVAIFCRARRNVDLGTRQIKLLEIELATHLGTVGYESCGNLHFIS